MLKFQLCCSFSVRSGGLLLGYSGRHSVFDTHATIRAYDLGVVVGDLLKEGSEDLAATFAFDVSRFSAHCLQ
jgi:hypothetical protein